MASATLRVTSLILFAAASGCSKESPTSGSSGTASSAAATGSALPPAVVACADTMAILLTDGKAAGAKATLRPVIAPSCAELSPKLQACVAQARSTDSVDACFKDEPKATHDKFEQSIIWAMKDANASKPAP